MKYLDVLDKLKSFNCETNGISIFNNLSFTNEIP